MVELAQAEDLIGISDAVALVQIDAILAASDRLGLHLTDLATLGIHGTRGSMSSQSLHPPQISGEAVIRRHNEAVR